MSEQNGDKARFHRIRKKNIARRLSIHELQQKLKDAAVAESETYRSETPLTRRGAGARVAGREN